MKKTTTTPLGEVLTLPVVVKSRGGSPLIRAGEVTFLVSEVSRVAPLHFSWWWSGWQLLGVGQPSASMNAEYFKKKAAAVGGELCSIVSFKDGTTEMVLGHVSRVTFLIFGV